MYCIYCISLVYVLVILPPPDPTCCGRLSRNCVELLYGTLTDPSLYNSTVPCLYLTLPLLLPSWLSYTVPLLYPSDWVPQIMYIIKGGTRTPSTVCPFGATCQQHNPGQFLVWPVNHMHGVSSFDCSLYCRVFCHVSIPMIPHTLATS